MSTTPDMPAQTSPESPEEVTYCYAHKDTPTRLRCTRCDRPICGRCAIPASVGQHCPECVAEAARSAPKVHSALRANAPVVMTLLIVNVLMWLGQNFAPPQPGTPYDVLTFSLGAMPPAIADGQWYRLITPMFLHSPGVIWHIAFNSYALFLFGPNVEQGFGHVKFLILYLVAGFTGSAVSYAFGSCASLGVGASGAIFGILGALLIFLYNRRSSTFVRGYMKNILFLIGINLVIGQIFPNIDNLAHLGGLMGGVGIGFALDDAPGRKLPAGVQTLVAAAVVLAAVGLVMWRTSNFVCG